jgi:DedD protein
LDENLKQRIIGAVVIISCAVIFIPMIFDPENAEEFVLKSEIPAAPPKLNITIPDPVRPEATQSLQVDPSNAYSLLEEPISAEALATEALSSEALSSEIMAADLMETEPTQTEAVIDTASVVNQTNTLEKQSGTQPTAPIVESAKVKESMLNEEGLPKAWVIQVGSFKDKARALELEEILIKKGYRAFTRTTATKTSSSGESTESTRVYVGPKLEKSAALALKKSLDEDLKVSSLIIPFTADG